MSKPLRFGVIADVQYADKASEGARDYREALPRLKAAVEALRAEPNLAFVVQLGDLIDGRDTEEEALEDLRRVLEVLGRLEVPVIHVIGNHCLNLPRTQLLAELRIDSGRRMFIEEGVRFLVVDSMELSTMGAVPKAAGAEAAEAWLAAHPLEENPQAKTWNGGLGQDQREWLARELRDAASFGAPVIIFAHHPLLPEASSPSLVAWDCEEVLSLIDEQQALLLWMNGHAHAGGYVQRSGIHHLTIEGMVEVESGSNAWAVVEVRPDAITIDGHGDVLDRELDRSD